MSKHNGQKLAVGLGSARMTKATTPFPRGRHWGCCETTDRRRPFPNCACPSWSFKRPGVFDDDETYDGLNHTKGRQADGTARARTVRKGRPGASPLSLRDERDAQCKRIPRPLGCRTRHTPHRADVPRTNPVSPRRTPFSRRDVASGDTGPARCPALESSRFSAGKRPTAVE